MAATEEVLARGLRGHSGIDGQGTGAPLHARAEAANEFETRLGKYLSYIANTKRATMAASSRKLNPIWIPMFRH